MNCRGLTELVILNIGLDLGVIPPALFAMLVVMALVTTFMTTPLLSRFYRSEDLQQASAEQDGDGGTEDAGDADGAAGSRKYRILVPISKGATGHELVHTAMRLARDSDEAAEIVLLRVVTLPGSAYRAGPRVQEDLVRRASQVLRPLVQLVEGAGYDAVPVVVTA